MKYKINNKMAIEKCIICNTLKNEKYALCNEWINAFKYQCERDWDKLNEEKSKKLRSEK